MKDTSGSSERERAMEEMRAKAKLISNSAEDAQRASKLLFELRRSAEEGGLQVSAEIRSALSILLGECNAEAAARLFMLKSHEYNLEQLSNRLYRGLREKARRDPNVVAVLQELAEKYPRK